LRPGQQGRPAFGGGVSESIVNPGVLLAILVVGVLICVLSRKKATAVFLVAAILIPNDQVLLLGPAHFPMLRILVLFGFARIFKERSSKRPLLSGGFNRIDLAVMVLQIFVFVNGILLWQETGALVMQLGNLISVFGIYFLLRVLIRDQDDVVAIIQTLAGIALFIAPVMAYEITSGHNPYAILGGARAQYYATLVMRDGKFRAQGPFAHSILAGTFGAVLVPLFIALWWKAKKYRKLTILGVLASAVITLACNSSTPILAYGAGVMGVCLWPIRKSMRAVRWGIVVVLIVLHITMKGPVWSLIQKIDISGGSSSWHRYMLIDMCIRHFSDWWLIGIKDTSVWGWDMWDTANQYVSICEASGLIPFLLFIAILVYGFKYLGRARNATKNKKEQLFLWSLSSALFANCVAFFGISYFDQTMVGWYALLAAIGAVYAVRPKKEKKPIVSESSMNEVMQPTETMEPVGVLEKLAAPDAHPSFGV
jgi:hypothetical protein